MSSVFKKLGVVVCVAVIGLLVYRYVLLNKADSFTEKQAIHLLAQKTNKDYFYSTWIRPDCIQYATEKTTASYFDFALHEDHAGKCSGKGDPVTSPVIDRFRVYQDGKKILWYDVVNDEFIDYQQGIESRRPQTNSKSN